MPLVTTEKKSIHSSSMPLYFKEFKNSFLLTNDSGSYSFLKKSEFSDFIGGLLEKSNIEKFNELKAKGFISHADDKERLAECYAIKNRFLADGPSLAIMVLTLRCDHNCVYCQASSQSVDAKDMDMNVETAEKAVDFIFQSPNKIITIEFQGGEPLLNLAVLKHIVKYALEKNKKIKKELSFTVVSNLTYMNKDILDYLLKHKIHICTSLDGHELVHNKYRIVRNGKNSYINTVFWFKQIRKEYQIKKQSCIPSALTTISRFSLKYSQRIVDEYIKLGLEGIHLRPVSPFGGTLTKWADMSYTAEQFLQFYIKTLDYILFLNRSGKYFFERSATIFLTKILIGRDPGFLDLRSPCGAGTGQIAFNFDGNIYSCDEGRMLSRQGCELFKLGNIQRDSYEKVIDSPVIKTLCAASCLDGLPQCHDCVYKPYCGVCPLYNYVTRGDVFSKSDFLCTVNSGIMDYLFSKLKDSCLKDIFKSWIGITESTN